jgi:hypothetical protein
MGDKVVENNIEKWNEERQKFIANMNNNGVIQGSKEKNAIYEAKNLNIIQKNLSKCNSENEIEFEEKLNGLKVYILVKQGDNKLEKKEITNPQKHWIKKYNVVDYDKRSNEGNELKDLPKIGNQSFGLQNAFDGAMYLGKNKREENNDANMWLSNDGFLKLDEGKETPPEIKDEEGIKEALYGNTIEGDASVIETGTTGGRKSRKTRRKKRKPKKSKKSRKSRK